MGKPSALYACKPEDFRADALELRAKLATGYATEDDIVRFIGRGRLAADAWKWAAEAARLADLFARQRARDPRTTGSCARVRSRTDVSVSGNDAAGTSARTRLPGTAP